MRVRDLYIFMSDFTIGKRFVPVLESEVGAVNQSEDNRA